MWKKMFRTCLLLGIVTAIAHLPGLAASPQSGEEPSPGVETITGSSSELQSEEITTDTAVAPVASVVERRRQKNLETWYQFYNKGRPISDIIALVLLLGLVFVFEELRKIFFDSFRSRKLREMDLRYSTLEEVSKEVKKSPGTRLAGLLGSLLTLHRSTGSVESIQDEIDLFVRNLQERFTSFRARLDFLSDSAGALGLLGTVWGIFNAFESKDWRPENILPDIGFALVTTFIGIIVSLILNLLSTEVFNCFNRRIELLLIKVDEFRKNIYRYHLETVTEIMNRHGSGGSNINRVES